MMPCIAAKSPWIVTTVPNPAARLRLIGVPYAGSGASAFAMWPRALPADVEMCAVQMPGREARLGEPPLTRWDDVIDRLAEALLPWTQQGPFALFGHSLGAMVAFEIARRWRRDRRPGPDHLFVSGCRAPHLPLDDPPTHTLPHEKFVHAVRRLRGTPEEVLDCADLLDTFLPALRADFTLWETYVYRDDEPLGVPISAYGGIEDEHADASTLQAWRAQTTSAFRQVMFPGSHFFVNADRAAVLAELARELRTIAR
jgi:medium-chain acyl-[acyl-carrier-protein] hydrolase